jgi:hypothetical protein
VDGKVLADLFIWNMVIDGFFWADLLSNFRLAYVDQTATMIRDGPKIAKHYLATWFTADLLACIPFDLVRGWGWEGLE